MQQHLPRGSLLSPFIVLFLVVGSFGASVRYVELVRHRLGETALAYVRTTGPLLPPLTDMRLQLHRILSEGHSEPSARTRGARLALVLESRVQFNAAFQRYSQVASQIGARPFGGELAQAVERFNRTCDEVLRQVLPDVLEANTPLLEHDAHRRLAESGEEVTRLVMKEMGVGARASTDALAALDAANLQALNLAHTLYGLCALSALVGGVLAACAVRKHLRLSALYAELQASRATELEQFCGRVAHDILGPLQPVSLGLRQLGGKLEGDEAAARTLARIQRSLGRVRLIVDGLLRFARAGAQPEPGAHVELESLGEGLREDLEPGAREAGVELVIEPLPDVTVACSEAAVVVVWQNLIRNAVKYIGEGPRKQVVVRALVDASTVRLLVSDSGPGLPVGMERTVFEPYVRAAHAQQPGIGLGLATVKRIVEAHGGQVGVNSTPGQGCCFWVELPRVYREASAGSALPALGGLQRTCQEPSAARS